MVKVEEQLFILADKYRGIYNNSELIDLFLTGFALKAISLKEKVNCENIKNYEEINNLFIKYKYNFLTISNSLNSIEIIQDILKLELSSKDFKNIDFSDFFSKFDDSRSGIFLINPTFNKGFNKFLSLSNKSKVLDLNSRNNSLLKRLILRDNFKGEITFVSQSKLDLKLSFINLFLFEDVTLIFKEGVYYRQSFKDKYDLILSFPSWGIRANKEEAKEIIDFYNNLFDSNLKGEFYLLETPSFLFLNNNSALKYKELFFNKLNLDALVGVSSLFKGTGVNGLLFKFTKSKVEKVFIANVSSNIYSEEEYLQDCEFILEQYTLLRKENEIVKSISPITNYAKVEEILNEFSFEKFNPKKAILEKSYLDKDLKLVSLNEIAEVFSNNILNPIEKIAEGGKSPLIKVKDMGEKCDISKLPKINDSKAKVTKEGDILVSSFASNIKTVIITKELVDIIPGNNILVIRLKENYNPEYISKLLFSEYVMAQILSCVEGSTIPVIKKSLFEKIKLPVLALGKQKEFISKIQKIESRLKEIDLEKKTLNDDLKKLREILE